MDDSEEEGEEEQPMMAMAQVQAPMASMRSAPMAMKKMKRRAAPAASEDLRERQQMRTQQLYRPPEKTKEYAERGYWGHDQRTTAVTRVPANRFWEDCARKSASVGLQSILSPRWFEACSSLTEALLMLAVLDVPFANATTAEFPDGGGVVLRPAEPAVIFSRLLCRVEDEAETPLLVHQNFFESDARQVTDESGELVDKYIRDE